MTAFEVENISYSFNGNEVLKNVSFDVGAGEFFGISGPNGAGKSTLLKILSKVLKSQSGAILILGKSLEDFRYPDIAKVMGVLPAEIYIPYDFTVADIVLMGRTPHIAWWKDYGRQDRIIAAQILAELKIESFAHRSLNSLSSGERQKVFIAQALCQEPRILLLDEPTSHLDIKHQIEIFSLLTKQCIGKGFTIVVVSHDINLLSRYCSKMLMLKSGCVKAFGSPSEVITRENIFAVYGADSSIANVTPSGRPHVYITDV
jgi:iron complex transport system ATP-binding protein